MHIGVPFAAILAVIVIVYFATKALGISIRFPLLLSCGFVGLFLGLMLPRILLPQISLAGTVIILVLSMIAVSVALAWVFTKEDSGKVVIHQDVVHAQDFEVTEKNLEENIEVLEISENDEPKVENLLIIEGSPTIEDIIEEPLIEIIQPAALEEEVRVESISEVLPEIESEESEYLDAGDFDLSSLLGENLNILHYIPESKDIAVSQPVFTSVNIDAIRLSKYNESFLEEKIDTFENTISSNRDGTIFADKSEIASFSSDDIYYKKYEESEYVENGNELSSISAQEIINQDTHEENFEWKNNLVKFPVSETFANIDAENLKDALLSSKVIDFSAKLAQKAEKYMQNTEKGFNLEKENVYQSINFSQQVMQSFQTLDATNFETSSYGISFSDVQNITEEVATKEFFTEKVHAGSKEKLNLTRKEEQEYSFDKIDDYEDVESCEIIQPHCSDEDLPYQRIINTDHKKSTSLKKINKEMQTQLLPKPVPKSDSLDDLLDFAFSQRERSNFEDALMIFKMAYEMYPNSQMSMLLVAEIANTYKAKGRYDLAIDALQKGIKDTKEEMFKKEFVTSIAYMRIIKNILASKRLDLLPYDEIPDKVKEDIENEFLEWKSSS